MSILEFKNQIQHYFGILDWAPSAEQIKTIAREVEELSKKHENVTATEVLEIVLRNTEVKLQKSNEGIDNSDIKILLAMATKIK